MFQMVFPSHRQELKTAHTVSGICQTGSSNGLMRRKTIWNM